VYHVINLALPVATASTVGFIVNREIDVSQEGWLGVSLSGEMLLLAV
jgi:hypothetical protein